MGTVYENIARLCAERGISASRLCTDLGISRSTITELKSGRAKTMSYDKAAKIAQYFEVSVDAILGAGGPAVQAETADGDVVYLDRETMEYLEELRTRPEMKMLFKLSKNTTRKEIEALVKMVEALRRDAD
jgi:transcriptional regulator with XRE-family HTH domain